MQNESVPQRPYSGDTRLVAIKDQISCDLDDEAVILGLKDGMYYGLNQVGARIWSLIQAPRALKEIRDTLLEEFEVEASRLDEDLQAFLDEMFDRELIAICDEKVA